MGDDGGWGERGNLKLDPASMYTYCTDHHDYDLTLYVDSTMLILILRDRNHATTENDWFDELIGRQDRPQCTWDCMFSLEKFIRSFFFLV